MTLEVLGSAGIPLFISLDAVRLLLEQPGAAALALLRLDIPGLGLALKSGLAKPSTISWGRPMP